MTDEKRKTSLGPLLDGVAAQSMTAFDARLRENLIGAGVETEAEIETFKSIAQRRTDARRAAIVSGVAIRPAEKESIAHKCDHCSLPTNRVSTCGACLVKGRRTEQAEQRARWSAHEYE